MHLISKKFFQLFFLSRQCFYFITQFSKSTFYLLNPRKNPLIEASILFTVHGFFFFRNSFFSFPFFRFRSMRTLLAYRLRRRQILFRFFCKFFRFILFNLVCFCNTLLMIRFLLFFYFWNLSFLLFFYSRNLSFLSLFLQRLYLFLFLSGSLRGTGKVWWWPGFSEGESASYLAFAACSGGHLV